MKTQLIISIKLLLVFIVLTGIVYPLFITGLAQLTFPAKANGSLVRIDGKIVGSALIGQQFDSSVYFWPRPSAISYNPVPSAASNLGPTSDKLVKQAAERRDLFAKANNLKDDSIIPKEMIFASASGLDPHISPEAALLQLDRVAISRNYNADQKLVVQELIKTKTENPQFSVLGEPRINVFELNLALANMK